MVDEDKTRIGILIGEMANPRHTIFRESAQRGMRLSGLWVAAVVLLTGCATQKTEGLPDPVPAPSGPPAGKTSVSSAAQSNALTGPISVEAAIGRATRCSPQVIALQAAVEVAKQRKAAASNIPDPEAVMTWGKVNNDFGDAEPDVNDADSGIGGRVYVPDPFEMAAPRVNAGTASFQAERASLQEAKWIVESDVRRLYAEIQYLADDMALVADLAQQYDLDLAG